MNFIVDAHIDLGVYHDTRNKRVLSQLTSNHVNQGDDTQHDVNLKQAAHQFESLFLQTLLKNARKTTEGLTENTFFSSRETRFYQEMLDNQISSQVPHQQGLGIADLIVQQLSRYHSASSENSRSSDG